MFYIIEIQSRNAIITVHITIQKTTTTLEKKKRCKADFIKCNKYIHSQNDKDTKCNECKEWEVPNAINTHQNNRDPKSAFLYICPS
jgi:hypothetical protein